MMVNYKIFVDYNVHKHTVFIPLSEADLLASSSSSSSSSTTTTTIIIMNNALINNMHFSYNSRVIICIILYLGS